MWIEWWKVLDRLLGNGNIIENRCLNPINVKADSRKIDFSVDIMQV